MHTRTHKKIKVDIEGVAGTARERSFKREQQNFLEILSDPRNKYEVSRELDIKYQDLHLWLIFLPLYKGFYFHTTVDRC